MGLCAELEARSLEGEPLPQVVPAWDEDIQRSSPDIILDETLLSEMQGLPTRGLVVDHM